MSSKFKLESKNKTFFLNKHKQFCINYSNPLKLNITINAMMLRSDDKKIHNLCHSKYKLELKGFTYQIRVKTSFGGALNNAETSVCELS